jgi:hypothetical protein
MLFLSFIVTVYTGWVYTLNTFKRWPAFEWG